MIVDNIYNAPLYYNINNRFQKTFDFLKSIDLTTCREGSFEVDGKNIIAITSSNTLKIKKMRY